MQENRIAFFCFFSEWSVCIWSAKNQVYIQPAQATQQYSYTCLHHDKLNKLSYRRQTTQHLCTLTLRSPWHKTLRSTAFHAVLSKAALWWMTVIYWPDFPTFTNPRPCDAINPPWAIRFISGMGKLEWLDYNLVKVPWCDCFQIFRLAPGHPEIQLFAHNTSMWQTHSYIGIANAVQCTGVRRKKWNVDKP